MIEQPTHLYFDTKIKMDADYPPKFNHDTTFTLVNKDLVLSQGYANA